MNLKSLYRHPVMDRYMGIANLEARHVTLVLKGSVKTAAQKKEAEKLAKDVPNVQQVVKEIEVKPGKHSSPNA